MSWRIVFFSVGSGLCWGALPGVVNRPWFSDLHIAATVVFCFGVLIWTYRAQRELNRTQKELTLRQGELVELIRRNYREDE